MSFNQNYLFKSPSGEYITKESLEEKLRGLGATECDVLYVHTALNFGFPNTKIPKQELLNIVLGILRNLKVSTLCMPTFTFSFCNGKIYDPTTSKSKMGALNEFFRKQDNVIRSLDPLMSIALEGEKKYLATDIGNHSIGEGSTFDLLHNTNNVKFLFFGPKIGDCFTYVHYLEWLYEVDYRYSRFFKGTLIENNVQHIIEQDLFVRYNGITPNTNLNNYANHLERLGIAKSVSLGSGNITVVEKKGAEKVYLEFILKDPHYFVDIKYPYRDKTFILNDEMVAL